MREVMVGGWSGRMEVVEAERLGLGVYGVHITVSSLTLHVVTRERVHRRGDLVSQMMICRRRAGRGGRGSWLRYQRGLRWI